MYDEPIHSEIDVFNVVYQLRKERRYLVQTLSQYTYLYKCLYEHSQKNNSSWFPNVFKVFKLQDRCISNILLKFSQSSHLQRVRIMKNIWNALILWFRDLNYQFIILSTTYTELQIYANRSFFFKVYLNLKCFNQIPLTWWKT